MTEKKGIFGFLKGLKPNEDAGELASEQEGTIDPTGDTLSGGSVSKSVSHDITPEITQFCVDSLSEILEKSKLVGNVSVKESTDGRLYLDISNSGDDVSRIIGKAGANLEAMQVILRHFVIRKFAAHIKVVIDADHYRQRRYGAVKAMAIDAANSLKYSGDQIKLEAMSPYERSVVHILFEDDESITTESEGYGHSRCVVLTKA
jgi:spoIIIJ-associated protein